MTKKIEDKYDAVVVAVSHLEYSDLTEDYLKSITNDDGIIFDLKGIYRNKIKDLTYWSL